MSCSRSKYAVADFPTDNDSTRSFGGSGEEDENHSSLFFFAEDLMSSPETLLSAGCSPSGIDFVGMEERQNRKEIQKQRKREIDRRHREKKKKEAAETKNKLDLTIKENETLRCLVEELKQENDQLREQLKSIEPRPDTTDAELSREIGRLWVCIAELSEKMARSRH